MNCASGAFLHGARQPNERWQPGGLSYPSHRFSPIVKSLRGCFNTPSTRFPTRFPPSQRRDSGHQRYSAAVCRSILGVAHIYHDLPLFRRTRPIAHRSLDLLSRLHTYELPLPRFREGDLQWVIVPVVVYSDALGCRPHGTLVQFLHLTCNLPSFTGDSSQSPVHLSNVTRLGDTFPSPHHRASNGAPRLPKPSHPNS